MNSTVFASNHVITGKMARIAMSRGLDSRSVSSRLGRIQPNTRPAIANSAIDTGRHANRITISDQISCATNAGHSIAAIMSGGPRKMMMRMVAIGLVDLLMWSNLALHSRHATRIEN
jgi:hypothetical protein